MKLSAPQPLSERHDLRAFNSGEAGLDEWLRKRAFHNHITGAARTFVACSDRRVVAYYALAAGAIAVVAASGRFRRNMPDPIPVIVLARLAVDGSLQGQGDRQGARAGCHVAHRSGR